MAVPPPVPAPPAGLSLTDLWLLLSHNGARLAACVAFTALSVACAVMVPLSLGGAVDIISRTAATPRELAAAVGKLGAVYITANCSLAVQASGRAGVRERWRRGAMAAASLHGGAARLTRPALALPPHPAPAQVALSLSLGESMAHRLRCRLFGALLHRDPLFYDSVRTGQMVAWLGQDIKVLQGTVSKLLGARGIRSAFETLGILLVLATLSWPLALALLVSAPLLTPLIAQLGRKIGAASRAAQAASNDVSAAASEVVENMRVVKLFAQQQRELARFGGLLETAHTLAVKVGGGGGGQGPASSGGGGGACRAATRNSAPSASPTLRCRC